MEELSMDLLSSFEEGTIDFSNDEVEEFTAISEPPTSNNSADADPEGIFKKDTKEVQEIVSTGNEEDLKKDSPSENSKGEDATKQDGSKTSPSDTPILASVAKACFEDGIFPDLSAEEIELIKDAESFAAALKKQIDAGLSTEQKRLKEMLNAGVEPDEVQHFEGALNYLSNIKEEEIEAEGPEGELLRKKLIYNDFLNRGFKAERAQREVERSINAGTDLEDAKTSLESCVDFYKEQYEDLITQRKAEAEKLHKAKDLELKEFKEKVLNTTSPFDGLSLDKSTREKVYENMTKTTYKSEAGNLQTPIQKYIQENNLDAHYYLSLMFTLTDGFKNIDKLVTQKVKSAKKSALRELDHTLNNTRVRDDGSVNFMDTSSDSESFDFIDSIDDTTWK